MRRLTNIISLVFLLQIVTFYPTMMEAAEKTPPKVIKLAETVFAKWGSEPVIIKAVNAQNAKKKKLGQIKELDARWQATAGIVDYMKQLMDSSCGKYLRSLQKKIPAIAEIFVMDNQGANVAMTDKTTDYWQGDEAKFIKCFNKGKGSIYLGDVEFDDSSQAYLVQISVPVKHNGNVIGVITIGVDVDKVE